MNPLAAQLRGRLYDYPPREIVAVHDYRDETGSLLCQLVRLRPRGRRWRRSEPGKPGGWAWTCQGMRRVLYRLPQLLAADPATWVFIVNTERVVDALAALGLVTTCCPGGMRKWSKLSDWSALAGRKVCIIAPTKSLTAWIYAEDVARRLHRTVAEVKVLALPSRGGDVIAWIGVQRAAKGKNTRV
jgi:hypothetical protein